MNVIIVKEKATRLRAINKIWPSSSRCSALLVPHLIGLTFIRPRRRPWPPIGRWAYCKILRGLICDSVPNVYYILHTQMIDFV